MAGTGESDVRGTYDVLVITTRRRPWIDSPELKDLVERSFERAFADIGVRVDRMTVEADRVIARITIVGDYKRTAKAFVHVAKSEAVRMIRAELPDDMPSWFYTLGLFANEVMVRTVGTGFAHVNLDAFIESVVPRPQGVKKQIEYAAISLDDETK